MGTGLGLHMIFGPLGPGEYCVGALWKLSFPSFQAFSDFVPAPSLSSKLPAPEFLSRRPTPSRPMLQFCGHMSLVALCYRDSPARSWMFGNLLGLCLPQQL